MTESRNVLQKKVIERAMKDEDFRNKLRSNPKNAIEETIGVELPGNINFHVNEETQNDIHITLPRKHNELSEKQLSGISGGWSSWTPTSEVPGQ